MSAKSSRPEPGWYTANSGVTKYVIAFDNFNTEVWIVLANKPNIYTYKWPNSPLTRDDWDWELEKL